MRAAHTRTAFYFKLNSQRFVPFTHFCTGIRVGGRTLLYAPGALMFMPRSYQRCQGEALQILTWFKVDSTQRPESAEESVTNNHNPQWHSVVLWSMFSRLVVRLVNMKREREGARGKKKERNEERKKAKERKKNRTKKREIAQ